MRYLPAIAVSLFFMTNMAFAQTTTSVSAAQKIIADQISAFLEGDDKRAFSHAAPQIRQLFTTADKFIAMVKKGYKPLFLPNSFRFTKNKLAGEMFFQELIVTGESGKKWRAVYSLKLQGDGMWKITGVVLQGLVGDAI